MPGIQVRGLVQTGQVVYAKCARFPVTQMMVIGSLIDGIIFSQDFSYA